MKEIHDIATSLLDVDGSCRDLNFENPTWPGVDAMLKALASTFEIESVTDADGADVSGPPSKGIRTLVPSGGRALMKNGAFVKQLQIFVFREDDGRPFVELTFFPQDVVQSDDVRGDFLEWADRLARHLGALRFYARYENASWQFGDSGPQSGVFAVSGEINADS